MLRWIGQHELGVALSVLALGGGLWAFVEIADEISEGSGLAFDDGVLALFRAAPGDPLGPVWLEDAVFNLGALGSLPVLLTISAFLAGYFWITGRWRELLVVLAAVVGAVLISNLLKLGFGRPRPELVASPERLLTASFPSGHSMQAAAVYLTLGALFARFHDRLLLKAYALFWAGLLALVVGLSRIYLGAHWPTDVLAGWAGGAVWAALCWLAARALQRRGALRHEDPISISGGAS